MHVFQDYEDEKSVSICKPHSHHGRIKTKQQQQLDPCMYRSHTSCNMTVTGAARTPNMPTGIHRANLPQCDRKGEWNEIKCLLI